MAEGVIVIANSTAGNGAHPGWTDGLEQKFAAAGVPARLRLTQQGSEIEAAVADAVRQGATTVVAGGGDGTVSAVAAALAGTGTTLGVLPMGTLNHFAKDLKLPLELDAAIAVIAQGRVLEVDVGEVNGRIFINNSSLGLYPDIVLEREQLRRRLGHGKWRALLEASINAARRYPVMTVRIEVDGKTLTRRTPFVFIGNNRYTMEGFEIGVREALTDGELSLYVAQRTGRFGLLRLAFMALLRRLDQARDFDVLAGSEFAVDTRHRRLRVATDGEVAAMEPPLLYRVRPGALRVLVPADKEPT